MSANQYSDTELRELDHNDHGGAFRGYLEGNRHISDKQAFLRSWVNPAQGDCILECGSSSGKTSIDFARTSDCFCLGVDFDPEAVEISSTMRDEHFPELAERCQFQIGDLAKMQFEHPFNKVLMPDFSEHIPDRVLSDILRNLSGQLADVTLYMYTPNRSHIFEILKHRNILLKNSSGHINVKTRKEMVDFLQENGWRVIENSWRISSIPIMRNIEFLFGHIPLIGGLFQRRIVITAKPAAS